MPHQRVRPGAVERVRTPLRGSGDASIIHFTVNGVALSVDSDPEMPVLWYLRDVLGLRGTKFGCGVALCGACTVHQAMRSCVVPVRVVEGTEITTIEGVGAKGLHP